MAPPNSIQTHSALATATLLALCACTGENATQRTTRLTADAIDIPTQWRATPATTQTTPDHLAQWWQRFNDPALDQLITYALHNNPGLRTALSRIAEARARYGTTRATLLPTLNTRGAATRTYHRNHTSDTAAYNNTYTAALDATWEIDLFGKNHATLNAAAAEHAQTLENYHAAQVSLAAEIAEAYTTLRATETQHRIVEQTLENRRQTTGLAQFREQVGQGTSLDTAQATTALDQTQALLPTLQNDIAQSRNRLALLTGKKPGDIDPLLITRNTPHIPAPPQNLALGIPAQTLRQRPDVRAAEHALHATAHRLDAAEREALPSLNLNGSIGIEALKKGSFLSPEATIGTLAAGLVAPVFEGGRIRQNINIHTEQQAQALLAYEETLLTALAEVENALIGIQHITTRLSTLRTAHAAATTATQLAAHQYQAGQSDITTLLETQRNQLSIEEQLTTTTAQQTIAHIHLYKALGGGWTPPSVITPN
ncbi:MAG: efflux transporter outer membrane subunit [Puniceicoccales bacterium]|jgi:NodT family efflux transporter outer membrane factor (OMF) lipoprotein|nr:efflux transporter outer membrane subunit [Puniceicoccales bacterium]